MAKITPLAPDSAGFKVLSRLYDLNGTAIVSQLTEVLYVEFRSPARFEKIVTVPLVCRGLVTLSRHDCMRITPEGRLMIEAYRRSIPSPRIVPMNTKPLDLAKHLRFGDMRPGALDYREMPSIMGGERVPFRHAGGKRS